jgi:DNA replication and repair protein RecF
MHVERLRISNFRNYQEAELEFSSHFNLIFGQNAQGKTNLLEALYLICLGRSFRSARNQDLVRFDCASLLIEGSLILDNQISRRAVVRYTRDGKKEISIDRKKIQRHSKIFGQFPIVVMAPDEFKITSGGPAERRKFVDILLSQISVTYLSNLQDYTRVLKQRNRILQNAKSGSRLDPSALAPWTENLIKIGSKIVYDRYRFIRDFSRVLTVTYNRYSETRDELTVELKSRLPEAETDRIEATFSRLLNERSSSEKVRGMTLVGPHRDDLDFSINGADLRSFGSRGEHKSALISLKLAEFKYLELKKEEKPVLLLDDCYSELDNSREQSVLNSLGGLGQIFVTTPRKEVAEYHEEFLSEHQEVFSYEVTQGQVQRCR